MLPTYQRPGASSSSSMFNRKSYRAWEKCLILLVLVTFGFVCFGGLFFLPDNFGADKVLRVYRDFQKAGPEIFLPPPPVANSADEDRDHNHLFGDKEKLAAKIRNELGDILEKPDTIGRDYSSEESPLKAPAVFNKIDKNRQISLSSVLVIENDADSDPLVQKKRDKVKEVSFTIVVDYSNHLILKVFVPK